MDVKVGDTLYVLVDLDDDSNKYKRIKCDNVTDVYINEDGIQTLEFEYIWHDQPASCIGKDIFFTLEEAEQSESYFGD